MKFGTSGPFEIGGFGDNHPLTTPTTPSVTQWRGGTSRHVSTIPRWDFQKLRVFRSGYGGVRAIKL